MRFRYANQELVSADAVVLPQLSFILRHGTRAIDATGLVDSGSTVNVLPYRYGIQLGAVWNERLGTLRLAGNLGHIPAQPLFAMIEVGDFAPVRLAFAWSQSDDIPLILGQMNFFMEFDVCFYRSHFELEINPKVD